MGTRMEKAQGSIGDRITYAWQDRGTEAEEAIQRRLNRAQEELQAQTEFDAVIVNDDLETALAALEKQMNLTVT